MLSLQLPSSFPGIATMPPLDRSLGNISSSSSHSSACPEPPHCDECCETRTARTALCASLVPLLNFLRKHGVSNNSIDELWILVDKEEYVAALQRATTYADCLADTTTILSSYFLLLGCWNTSCRLSSLQYKSAFKYYHNMRRNRNIQQPQTMDWHHSLMTTNTDSIEIALAAVNKAGELCCTCQRELILARQREKRIASSLQSQCSR